MSARQLAFIFTRDFSLWINEIIRREYVNEFPKIWGRGLEDQLVHFDGRVSRWYRYADDYEALAEYVCRLDLSHPLFSVPVHKKFREMAEGLKIFMRAAGDGQDEYARLREFSRLFQEMYPVYTFSIFLAGAWRERFLALHGPAGQTAVDLAYESRILTEGLIKLSDLYLLGQLAPKLAERGYPDVSAKLCTVAEVEEAFRSGRLPDQDILAERARGYFLWRGGIVPIAEPEAFLAQHSLELSTVIIGDGLSCQGTMACTGALVRAPAQVFFTTEEIKGFRPGSILVTPMTSVEYLSAMKQAAAIVTDEGGLTCHAAIVAREFNIPCVVGIRKVTQLVRDGDIIEVDAIEGFIKRIA